MTTDRIVKTDAFVLSVTKFGDTSKIASFYTKEFGKLHVILKGARGSNSKIGRLLDPLNEVSAVIYRKEKRDIQLLSNLDLINSFGKVERSFDELKFSLAVVEAVDKLTVEGEKNIKLYSGIKRILERISERRESPEVSFGRFFFFLLAELGYEPELKICGNCFNDINDSGCAFHFEKGFVCSSCKNSVHHSIEIGRELFEYFHCLKSGKDAFVNNAYIPTKANRLMMKFLSFHVPLFRKIHSLFL